MKILYLDATAGISGDMTVAALLDLGLPLEYLQQELAKLGLPEGSFSLSEEKVIRCGMEGRHFNVLLPHEHHHDHHHYHRRYADIRRMIADSRLAESAKELAQRIFLRLAEAEAFVHNQPVDEVAFHEVGAVDSIVDIVGAAIGLDRLGVEKIYVSALPLGGGFVETAHGRLPVPAPATAELLKGLAVHGSCAAGERVTPTGAAILAALAESVARMPVMTVEKVGYGAGSMDFEDCPNILRVFSGTASATELDPKVFEVRCNLDDVTPEVAGYTFERLMEAGALDVWQTAIQMKKNRSGLMLSFLCMPESLERLAGIAMAETGTLGVRFQKLDRIEASRSIEDRATEWGMVRFKVSGVSDKPEYEDCRRIAIETGLPLRLVQKKLFSGGNDDR